MFCYISTKITVLDLGSLISDSYVVIFALVSISSQCLPISPNLNRAPGDRLSSSASNLSVSSNKHSLITSKVSYICFPPVRFDLVASHLSNFTRNMGREKKILGISRHRLKAHLPYLPFSLDKSFHKILRFKYGTKYMHYTEWFQCTFIQCLGHILVLLQVVLGYLVSGQEDFILPTQAGREDFKSPTQAGQEDFKSPTEAGPSTAPPNVVPGASAAGSPISWGTMSDSSGGPGSPLNQSTQAYNNRSNQQEMNSLSWLN